MRFKTRNECLEAKLAVILFYYLFFVCRIWNLPSLSGLPPEACLPTFRSFPGASSTQLIPARQGNSQDYLPLGLYFNTSDPWSNSTDKQDSVCEQELIMYVSVLWKLVIVFFFYIVWNCVTVVFILSSCVFIHEN